jgi:hypothetical protein
MPDALPLLSRATLAQLGHKPGKKAHRLDQPNIKFVVVGKKPRFLGNGR